MPRASQVIYDIREDVPATMLSKNYLPCWLRLPLERFIHHVERFSCVWFSVVDPATPDIADHFSAFHSATVLVRNSPFLDELASSDFPLWRQIIEEADCGLLVNTLDVKAIAVAIDVLTHSKETEAMGKRGRKAVEERYNWEKEESKLLQLYRQMMDNRL